MNSQHTEPATLDPQQVAKIGRVHHGMLYQHVLAACLIAKHASEPFYLRLIVERDEDIEVVCDGVRHYLQVKVEDSLAFSELYKEILRLHELRMLHANKTREGRCRLYLVSGGTLGEELRVERGSDSVLEKVRVLARRSSIDEESLIETWRSITFVVPGSSLTELGDVAVRFGVIEQLDVLTALLSNISRLANAPIVSAYALATSIHALAADSLRGFTARTVLAADTLRLIDVVQRQVEALTDLPKFFVPLPLTADIFRPGHHCLLVGSSGSGKTSQLSYFVAQASLVTIYIRPVELTPDDTDADLVLQLRSGLERLGVAPSQAGSSSANIPAFEALRYLVAAIPLSTVLIIDDAHLLHSTAAVRQFVRDAVRRQDITVMLAAQPTRPDGQAAASFVQSLAAVPITIIDVPGWGLAETSLYLHLRQIPADPVLAESLRRTAHGAPIAVAALLDVCRTQFDNNLEQTLVDIARDGFEPTVHGIVSAQYRALPEPARRVAAAIALTRLPRPNLAEVERVLMRSEARSGFAYLRENRILLRVGNSDRFELHELYQSVARSLGNEVFDENQMRSLHSKALVLLRDRLHREHTLDLVVPVLLNQALAGDISEVVDELSGEGEFYCERLQRIGLGTPIAELIEQLLPLAEDEDRFWLLDALVFLNVAEDLRRDDDSLWNRYASAFVGLEDPSTNAEVAFNLKSMRRAAANGDIASAGAAWYAAQKLVELGPLAGIVTSEYANALWKAGQFEEAWIFAQQALNISTLVIGIDSKLLWSQEDPTHVLAQADVQDVSRLADNIELLGYILESQGDNPIPMFSRSAFIFDFIGAEKSGRKSEHRLLLNRARETRHRQEVRDRLQQILKTFREQGFVGGLIDVTAALVSLARLMGDHSEASILLESVAVFDQKEVDEAIASAEEVMTRPLTSALALQFIRRQTGQ